MLEIRGLEPNKFNQKMFLELLQQSISTKEWMVEGIYESRAKDYANPFRKMVYDTKKEMEKVVGRIEDNTFIQQQLKELDQFKKKVKEVIKKMQV